MAEKSRHATAELPSCATRMLSTNVTALWFNFSFEAGFLKVAENSLQQLHFADFDGLLL